MTYASELTRQQQKLDAVLVLDGIPILFGTRSGRIHDGTGITNPPTAPFTSYAAIVPGSIRLGKRELDIDSALVKPAKVSLSIAMNTVWNKYFEARRQPQAYLAADMTKTSTTVTLSNDTIFSEATYAYIERETVLLGTSASPSFINCTRNCVALAGTSGYAHPNSTDNVAAVTPGYVTVVTGYPQYMLGRPAMLRIFAGESDSAYQDFAGMRLASSPVFNLDTGTIDLTFDDGMSYYARKIATGVRGTYRAATSDVVSSNETFVQFTASNNFIEFQTGTDNGYGLVTVNGYQEPFLAKIETRTGGPPFNLLTMKRSAFIPRGEQVPISTEQLADATIKRCYVFTEYPMECMLKVLLSKEGNGSNDSTWDVLAGKQFDTTTIPGDGESEFAFGAGVPVALVDKTTLELYKKTKVQGWTYVLGARGEETLLDLFEEVGWALGGFFYINSSGKISFRQWTAVYASESSNYTLTEDHIWRTSPLKSQNDESTILHTVSMQCNYLPGATDPGRYVAVIHQNIKNLYRDTPLGIAGTRTLKRKGLWVIGDNEGYFPRPQGNAPISLTDPLTVKQQLQRIFAKRSRGTRRYRLVLPWRYSAVVPGDRVTVTHSLLNAFDGSTLTAVVFDVIGVDYQYSEGTVSIDIDDTITGKRIAPALRISAYAANTPVAGQATLTLSSSNATWGGGTAPITYFQIGWDLAIHDRSSSPIFSTTSNHTIIAGGNGIDTLVISTLPAFTPVAGDIIQFRTYDSAAQTNANQAQGIGQHDYAFLCADGSFSLGAAADESHKWG
jgi:hypothetical protein